MANCETNGHLWGPLDACIMCKAPRPLEQRPSKKKLDFEQRRRAVELEETIDGDGAYDIAAEIIWSRDEIDRLQAKLTAAEQLAVRQGNEIRKLRAGEKA